MRRRDLIGWAVAAALVLHPAITADAQQPPTTVRARDDAPGSRCIGACRRGRQGRDHRLGLRDAGALHARPGSAGGLIYSGPHRQPGDPPEAVTFPVEGTYTFVCPYHGTMFGQALVGDTASPSPTPTATSSPSATPTFTPSPSGTPAPVPTRSVQPSAPPVADPDAVAPPSVPAARDTIAPAIRRLRVADVGRRLRIGFRLEERAAVRLRLRPRGGRARRMSLGVLDPGRHVRTPDAAPGRVTVKLTARDAAGNASSRRRVVRVRPTRESR